MLSIINVETLDEAIEIVNSSRFGNGTSIFTESGASVRRYRHEVEAGMIGVNIGVAAPVAFFPFSGWKDSFLGDLHAHGPDAVEFFTRKKTVTVALVLQRPGPRRLLRRALTDADDRRAEGWRPSSLPGRGWSATRCGIAARSCSPSATGVEVYAETRQDDGRSRCCTRGRTGSATWAYEALGRRVELRAARRDVVVDDRKTGLPIHGDAAAAVGGRRGVGAARWSPSASCRTEPAFPFPHRVRLEAELSPARRCGSPPTLEALDGPVPVSFGFHPYLTLPGVPRDEYEVELPLRRRLVLDRAARADG